MLEGFLDTIKGIGIFILCAQTIVHFRPKASYEKYIKVLVSLIVLAMLIVPCFQLFGDAETFLVSMEQYDSFLSGEIRTAWWDNGMGGEKNGDHTGDESFLTEIEQVMNEDVKSEFNIETIHVNAVEVTE